MPVSTVWYPGMPTTQMNAGQAAMQTGYTLASSLIADVMVAEAPMQLQAWKAIQGTNVPQVLVVDGDYDQMHFILEAAKVPYARIPGGAHLSAALSELPNIRAILINCGHDFPQAEARRAAQFVEAGGLLVTTDWALKTVLEVAFPRTIAHNGRKTGSQEFVEIDRWKSDALPAPSRNALAKLVENAPERPRWWLESQSFPIRRLSKAVEILLYSRQLKAAHGNGSVMVRFPHGEGWVYHMISHAFLQHRAPVAWPQSPADAAAAGSTVVYTQNLGASGATMKAYQAAQEANPEMDASVAANTAASLYLFLEPIIGATRQDKPGKGTDGQGGGTEPYPGT